VWSSESAHISGHDDSLITVAPLLEITEGKWENFLGAAIREEEIMKVRRHEQTGRPPDSGSFDP
jgi:hypothetical protein